jgi:hypothetical protein
MTSMSQANYSEFGLIVGAAGMANGWYILKQKSVCRRMRRWMPVTLKS